MPQDGVPMVVVYLKDAVIPQILKLIMVNYYYHDNTKKQTKITLKSMNEKNYLFQLYNWSDMVLIPRMEIIGLFVTVGANTGEKMDLFV